MSTPNDLATMTVDSEFALTDARPAKGFRIPRHEEMTMNQKISEAILARVTIGEPVNEAVDHLLGDGTFEALISDLYAELRGEVTHV